MKKLLSLLLVVCMAALPALSLAEAQTEIIVFAAASMTETLTEIKALYEAANPGVVLTYNFDSSGTLKTQIQEGAECDLRRSEADGSAGYQRRPCREHRRAGFCGGGVPH